MNSEPRTAGDAPPKLTPSRPIDLATLRECIPLACPELASVVAQRAFGVGCAVAPPRVEAHRIRVVATGAIREEAVLEDGRRQVLRFLLKGDAIVPEGELAGVRYVGVRSGILYDITEESLSLCKCRPVRWEVWRQVHDGTAASTSSRHIVLLGRYSAEERIADFLDDLVERIGVEDGGACSLSVPMGREDIADHLGLKAETVSRQLGPSEEERRLLDLLKPGQRSFTNDRKRLSAPAYVPHFSAEASAPSRGATILLGPGPLGARAARERRRISKQSDGAGGIWA